MGAVLTNLKLSAHIKISTAFLNSSCEFFLPIEVVHPNAYSSVVNFFIILSTSLTTELFCFRYSYHLWDRLLQFQLKGKVFDPGRKSPQITKIIHLKSLYTNINKHHSLLGYNL